ncbi:hypothetical protein D9757_007469 [Collybiopsis confluens]|uniref:Uncharacterized protein n=1 Tax=Collybiopsis confluens TaxID=2823264 RepID=A0A8H5M8H4_9AGAR|nr:hypothetical protein D9757_007469 [Collybiopsis confluens]
MKLANRTFVVSGGSSGLGLASVVELLKANVFVAILDRLPPPSTEDLFHESPMTAFSSSSSSSSSFPTSSSRLKYVEVDVTIPSDVEIAMKQVVAWTGSTGAALGGLINGAGVAVGGQLVDRTGEMHSVQDWNRLLAVNLSGTFHLSRLVAKYLVHVPKEGTLDGERGVIIMISSSSAYEGQAGQLGYAATKGAIRSMTLPMARDLARHNIRVVTIVPSPFETPMTNTFFTEKTDTSLKKNVMLYPRRYGLPQEFSATVRWILECAYVNGENLRISGGLRPSRLIYVNPVFDLSTYVAHTPISDYCSALSVYPILSYPSTRCTTAQAKAEESFVANARPRLSLFCLEPTELPDNQSLAQWRLDFWNGGCIFFVRNNVQADTEFAATDTKCYFGKITRRTALYAGALLAASIFNNGLIAYRIWTVRQRAASLGFMSSSRLETFGKILIESAALYTVVLLVDVILVMSNDILFLIFQEIQTPLIGIIFTNMIVSSSEGNAFGCTNETDPRNDSSLPSPRSHPDSYILTDINLQTIPTTRNDHIELPISDGDEAFAIRQVDRENIDKSPSPPPLARDSRLHLGASV